MLTKVELELEQVLAVPWTARRNGGGGRLCASNPQRLLLLLLLKGCQLQPSWESKVDMEMAEELRLWQVRPGKRQQTRVKGKRAPMLLCRAGARFSPRPGSRERRASAGQRAHAWGRRGAQAAHETV